MNPTVFTWWGWLLCATGIGIVVAIFYSLTLSAHDSRTKLGVLLSDAFGLTTIVLALASAACFVMGIIRFVKWAWGG